MQVVKKCNYCGKTYPTDLSFCLDDGKPLVEVETMIGRVIDGRYRLDSLIGKGGMGDVYRSTHVHIDSEFAVKLLKPEFVANETAIKRFRLEARAAGRIQHPNAVRVTDFGVSPENIVYLVMDLINGISLRSLVSDEKVIDYIRTVNIVRQICGAVDAAHHSGVIHRDIKPDNILIEKINQTERVKVLDFGIAKLRETTQTTDAYLTQAGTLIGTPQYMSPEQCQGKEIDTRSDIYSIGIILYEMLSGEVPFHSLATLQIVHMHLHDMPRPLSEVAPHVPEPLANVVLRALEKNPDHRQSSALELSDELKQAIEASGEARALSMTDSLTPRTISVSDVRTQSPDSPPDTKPGRSRKSIETSPKSTSGEISRDTSGSGVAETTLESGRPERVTAIDSSRPVISKKMETPPTIIQPAEGRNRRLPLMIIIGIALISIVTAIILMNMKSEDSGPPPKPMEEAPPGMVLIEGGKFLMGRNDGAPDEGPAHEVEIKPFLMDIQEVTNQDYKKFVDATGHTAPKHWKTNGSYAPDEALFPVTHVKWDDAVAYAKWASKRLPTEAEWEYVARGGSRGFTYPWGNEWHQGYANIDNDSNQKPAPVRSHVRDLSPFGVYDLAGNVSEWVEDYYSARYGERPDTRLRVYRGGNFLDPPETSTGTFRWSDFPSEIPDDQILRVGFRCAKTIE